MFSLRSTFSTIAELVSSGPRAVLARLLSSALAEHFEVDQDEIESSLLTDAKIVLKNARLRPRKFRSGGGAGGAILTSGGVVERVEFSWKWFSGGSNSGSTSDSTSSSSSRPGGLVQDAVLKIDGLKFRATVERWEDADEASVVECMRSMAVAGGEDEATEMDEVAEKESESYLTKYLQQIIDHLTLQISSFEFALVPAKGGPSIVVGGSDLELLTISSEHTMKASAAKLAADQGMNVPLRQTISFGSLFADVVVGHDESADGGDEAKAIRRLPILEPFSYTADARRVAGKRFMGGIGSGLEVTGRSPAADKGIVLHAEVEQMQGLSSMGALLAPPKEDEEGKRRTSEVPNGGDSGGNEVEADFKDATEVEDTNTSPAPLAADATIMVLPLPSMTLVLPGDTALKVPEGVSLSYRTDGRLFQVVGRSGIMLDDIPLLDIGSGADGNDVEWKLDLVSRCAVIESSSSNQDTEQRIAHVLISKKATSNLSRAISALVTNRSALELSDTMASLSSSAAEEEMATDPFTFSCRGAVGLRLEGNIPEQALDATIHSFSAAFAPDPLTGQYALAEMKTEGLELGPFSQGTVCLKVPPASISTDGSTLNVDGSVTSSVDSFNTLLKLKEFLSGFAEDANIDMLDPSPQTEKDKTKFSKQNELLPFAIKINEIKADESDSGASINATAIHLRKDLGLLCEQLSADDGKGTAAVVRGMTVANDFRTTVDSVEELGIAGVARLVEPIPSSKATFNEGWLQVKLPSVRVAVEATEQAPDSGQPGELTARSELSLPFHINIVANKVIVEKVMDNATVDVSGIDACLKVVEDKMVLWNQKAIEIQVEGSNGHWVKAAVQPSSLWLYNTGKSCGSLLDQLSELKCGGVKLGPSSFGHVSARIPQTIYRPDANNIRVNGTVEVDIESFEAFNQTQAFIQTVLTTQDVGASNLSAAEGEGQWAATLPYPAIIQEIKLTIADLNATARATSVVLKDKDGSCERLSVNDGKGTAAALRGLKVATDLRAMVESVEALKINGVTRLVEPTAPIQATYNQGWLQVKVPTIRVAAESPEHAPADRGEPGELGAPIELSLPFHINIVANKVVVEKALNSGIVVASGIDACFKVVEDKMVLWNQKAIEIQVEGSNGHWVKAAVQPSSIWLYNKLSGSLIDQLSELKCGGVTLGPSSFSNISARIPQTVFSPDANSVSVNGTVEIDAESIDAFNQTQAFIQSLMAKNNATSNLVSPASLPEGEDQSLTSLPYPITIQEIKLTIADPNATARATSVVLKDKDASCDSFHFTQVGGSSVSAIGVAASLERNMLEIKSIFTAEIPGLIRAVKPIQNMKVAFREGAIEVNAGALELISLLPQKKAPGPTSESSTDAPLALPFPVVVRLGSIGLKGDDKGSSLVRLQNFQCTVESSEGTTVAMTNAECLVHISSSPSDFVEMSVGTFGVAVKDSMTPKDITLLHISDVSIGSSSMGHFQVSVRSIDLPEGQQGAPITIPSLTAETQDIQVLQQVQTMVMCVMNDVLPPSDSSTEVPLPFVILEAKGTILEPRADVTLSGIKVAGSDASVASIQLSEKASGTSASISDMSVSNILDPNHKRVDIESIDSLNVLEVGMLSQPLKNSSVVYDGQSINMHLPCVYVATFEQPKPKMPNRRMSPEEWNAFLRNIQKDVHKNESKAIPRANGNPLHNQGNTDDVSVLPLTVRLNSGFISIRSSQGSDTDAVALNEVAIQLRPSSSSLIEVEAKIKRANHKLFSVKQFSSLAWVMPSRPNEVYSMKMDLREASVTAGFSSVDWGNLLGGSNDAAKPPTIYKTPHARIGATKVRVSYAGKSVSIQETSMDLPAFVGSATSTSEDIIAHYSSSITSRIPGILVNTEIMGTNIVDSSAINAGRVAMSNTLAGAGVGSVIGVAAVDSVKGAVRSGKMARGAGADDSYRFGDVTRGAIRGVGEAVKQGAERRRGNSSRYVPGDLTVGASAAAREYASENSSRLGGAAGGGVGALAGMAVLGPVGFIAGSYLGSTAGSKAVGGDSEEKSKAAASGGQGYASQQGHGKPEARPALPIETTAGNQIPVPVPAPTVHEQQPLPSAPPSHDADLLGLGGNALPVSAQMAPNTPMTQPQPQPHPQMHYGGHIPTEAQGSTRSHQGHECGYGSPVQTSGSAPYLQSQTPHQQQYYSQQQQQQQQQHYQHHQQQQQLQQQQRYRFGDVTKGLVAQGKQARGADKNEGYQFGDFTRGLFGGGKGK